MKIIVSHYPQWAAKGGHDTIGLLGPFDIVERWFLGENQAKMMIGGVFIPLNHSKKIFLGVFGSSPTPKKLTWKS